MSKFKLTKKVPLDVFSDEWKDCYLEFSSFTMQDLKEKIPEIMGLDEKDPNNVSVGIDKTIGILADHFISGKAIGGDGSLIDVTKEDLNELPAEVLTHSFRFLSQALQKTL